MRRSVLVLRIRSGSPTALSVVGVSSLDTMHSIIAQSRLARGRAGVVGSQRIVLSGCASVAEHLVFLSDSLFRGPSPVVFERTRRCGCAASVASRMDLSSDGFVCAASRMMFLFGSLACLRPEEHHRRVRIRPSRATVCGIRPASVCCASRRGSNARCGGDVADVTSPPLPRLPG